MKNFIPSFILLLFLISCKTDKNEYLKISGFIQGTTYHISYENSNTIDYSTDIDSILRAFDKSLSIYDTASIISRVNRNESNVVVDKWFETVFRKSEEVNRLSGGAFDITIGPISRAWGFGSSPIALHDTAHIDSLLQYVGMEKIRLENGKIIKRNRGVKLDVNAIAQGYSVDVICDFFESKNIKNYLVEIGGEVRCKGKNDKDKNWSIGIDKPKEEKANFTNELQTIIRLENKALATSGNYRKFFVEDGIKYSHTINPKTGFPARNTLLSATVIASDCITADALATVFMVIGIDKSKDLLQSLPNIEVFFIFNDTSGTLQTYSSKGLEKIISNPENL